MAMIHQKRWLPQSWGFTQMSWWSLLTVQCQWLGTRLVSQFALNTPTCILRGQVKLLLALDYPEPPHCEFLLHNTRTALCFEWTLDDMQGAVRLPILVFCDFFLVPYSSTWFSFPSLAKYLKKDIEEVRTGLSLVNNMERNSFLGILLLFKNYWCCVRMKIVSERGLYLVTRQPLY